MANVDTPNKALDRTLAVLRQLLRDEPGVKNVERVSDDTVVAHLLVAEHPDPDCEYVSQLTLVWDIPGQLNGIASLGIWNPPTPDDGFIQSPLLDLSEADQNALHAVIQRALAVPWTISVAAHEQLEALTQRLSVALIASGIPVSGQHFEPGAGLRSDKYHGLIREANGALWQWRDVIATTS